MINSIGFLMIATNKYLELWKNCAQSIIDEERSNSNLITIHLFTDQVKEADEWWKRQNTDIRLKTHIMPSYGWPQATLLRYQIFFEARKLLVEDILIYLDSDMNLKKSMVNEVDAREWINGIALVQHPGFYRPFKKLDLLTRLRNPYLFFQDVKYLRLIKNGMGSWENDRSSQAYVPRNLRKKYVHGAIWMGQKEAILNLIETLKTRVGKDLQRDFIAKWHDESHLNWYASTNVTTILGPEFSWYYKYKYLRHISPIVETIDKNLLKDTFR